MKNFFPKFKFELKKPKRASGSRINPHRHWILLLRLMSIAVVILIASSLYLLYKIRSEQIFQSRPPLPESKNLLREEVLKKVTGSFEEKEAAAQKIRSEAPSFKDPSL